VGASEGTTVVSGSVGSDGTAGEGRTIGSNALPHAIKLKGRKPVISKRSKRKKEMLGFIETTSCTGSLDEHQSACIVAGIAAPCLTWIGHKVDTPGTVHDRRVNLCYVAATVDDRQEVAMPPRHKEAVVAQEALLSQLRVWEDRW
jgi:hypothetical protein